MKVCLLALGLISFNALACWKVEGALRVNGESVLINQKFNHDKTYSFQARNYLFHVKIPSKFDAPKNMNNAKDGHSIEIQIMQKDGLKLTEISRDKILIQSAGEATMTKEDQKTKAISSFTFKITDI